MPKKQEKPWQYKFSFALSLVMLALVLGYFVQSFLEIRKVQPVRMAIERIGQSVQKSGAVLQAEDSAVTGNQGAVDEAAAGTKTD